MVATPHIPSPSEELMRRYDVAGPRLMGALCSLLSMDGYSAVGLCGTDEAIQRLRSEPFDAIITDVELPGEAMGWRWCAWPASSGRTRRCWW